MPIQATCQQCGATLPVPDEYAGQSVRCGGCRGVVKVPALAQPLAPVAQLAPLRARPVAVPVARKVMAEPKPEAPPVRKARKVRDDEDTPAEIAVDDDEPAKPKARPVAKKRRESILTVNAGKWLFCFLITGTVGLGILAYAAWGSRKNDGTAITAPPDAAVR